ncbi:MAG: gamma-glutamyltransferase family protein [Acidimicrobiia bacterium]|nr:gamma-glutamyltransferase family protein [Acidimicrobiia bacterium]
MFTTRPELTGTFGMVASTHWLASSVGMGVLERGGNAFDAAVAMGFVLHVAEPHMCGPGGDVPILLSGPQGEVTVLCGQGPAPAGATLAHYRGEGLDLVPSSGLLAAVVPGAVPAWLTLLRDRGTWPLRDVLEAAVGYAEAGVPLHRDVSSTIAAGQRRFLRHWPTSAATWLVGGEAPAAGSLLPNPVLAATWRRLVEEAEAAGPDREAQLDAALRQWGEGFVAEAIDRFARVAVADGAGGHYAGVLRGQDLAGWRPGYEAPVTFDYHGVEVAKCGPWSQGPVALQVLALLAGFDLDDVPATSAPFVHLVTEATKLAYADREAFYGDPAHVAVPLDVLLSPAYNDERRRLIDDRASLELVPGRLDGHGGPVDYAAAVARGARLRGGAPVEPTAAMASGPRVGPPTGDTVHLDVADRWGNLVSATPSGGWLQASPVVDGLGFPLGTRAQMFWLEEGHPSTLAPGKRPRTTLTPSLARRDGRPWMAYGTPGGDGQDQWQVSFLLRLVHGGMNLQEAIDAPSFHSEHMPSSFWPRDAKPGRVVIEDRFGEDVVDELGARGHDVVVGPAWSEGRLSAVAREVDEEGRAVLRAGANPRGMAGYAVGR